MQRSTDIYKHTNSSCDVDETFAQSNIQPNTSIDTVQHTPAQPGSPPHRRCVQHTPAQPGSPPHRGCVQHTPAQPGSPLHRGCVQHTHTQPGSQEVINSKKGLFNCETCNKRFTKLSSLISHELVHTEERRIVCEICQKVFPSASDLRVHRLIHTGEHQFLTLGLTLGFNALTNTIYI